MSDENQLSPSAAAMRPRPIIPPLPLRAAAYLIDIVILYFIGYTLETFLRDPLLALGPMLPFLSTVLMFVYFWMGNGPVGRGATPGKSILNMHTVRPDGAPLSWREAFHRTLLHFPPVYTATFMLFRDGLGLPELWTSPISVLLSTFSIFLFAMNGFTMLIHPLKRGLHDLSGGSIVTSDPTPPLFIEMMKPPQAEGYAASFRAQRKVLVIFGAVVGVILLGQWTLALINPRLRMDMRTVDAFNRDLKNEGYAVVQVFLPEEKQRADFESLLKNPPPQLVAAMPEGLTTDTLRREVKLDGDTVIFIVKKRFGGLSESVTRSSGFMGFLEALRSEWNKSAPAKGPASNPEHREARRIIISVADPFQFAFFPARRGQLNAWAAEGPTDPAKGGFKLEKIKFEKERKPPAPQPAGNNTPTTPTQPLAK